MEEKELNRKDIPYEYQLCFNEECLNTDGLAFDHYETDWDFDK